MTTDGIGSVSPERFQETDSSSSIINNDLLGIILSHLRIQDIPNVSRISKQWYVIAQKDLFSVARSLEALKTYSKDSAEKQKKTRKLVAECLKRLRGKSEEALQAFRAEAAKILVAQLPEGVPEDDRRENSSEKFQRRLYPLNSIFIMLEVVFNENYKPTYKPNSGYQFESRPAYISVFSGLAELNLVDEAVKAVQKTSQTLDELNVVIPYAFQLEDELIKMAKDLAFRGRKEALQMIDKLRSITNAGTYEFKSDKILDILIKLAEFKVIDLADEVLKNVVDSEVKYSALIEIASLQHQPEILDQIKPLIAALEGESLKERLIDRLERTQTEIRTFNQAFEKARKIITSKERFQALADLAEQEAKLGKVGSAFKCLEMISGEELDRYRVNVACALEQSSIADKYEKYRVLASFHLMEQVTNPDLKAIYDQRMIAFWKQKVNSVSATVYTPYDEDMVFLPR